MKRTIVKRTILSALSAAGCAFVLALPAIAATKPAVETHKTTTPVKAMVRTAWPPETLSGTILMVNPTLQLAVVKGPDGIPFDLIVTRATRIESGNQALKLSDLSSDTNKSVSVRFVPERKGDVARSIQVSG